jgi:hypothetical protein
MTPPIASIASTRVHAVRARRATDDDADDGRARPASVEAGSDPSEIRRSSSFARELISHERALNPRDGVNDVRTPRLSSA